MNTSPTNQPQETRRAFLQKTVAATAAVASTNLLKTPVYGQAQAPSTGRVIGANDRIVIGVVGTGSRGMDHIRTQKPREADDNVVQAAVCDLYQKRLGNAKTFLGLSEPDTYTDYRRLLERKDIDAVVVACVDVWHAQVAIDAMESGKHVYGEKPLARYLDEGFRIYDTVKRTGKVFQIGSQYCSDTKYHKAAEWIRAGKLGPLAWVQGSYCRNNPKNSEWTYPVDEGANPGNLDWNRWQGNSTKVPWASPDKSPAALGLPAGPNRYFSWHKYYAYNSGIYGNLLSHTFLPLLLATGNPEFPRRVASTGTRKISTDREISDTVHMLAEMPNGLTFCVAGSTVNEQGLAEVLRGRKGTIYFSLSQNKLELRPERPFAEEIEPESFGDGSPVGSLERHKRNFFDCIRTGGTPNGSIDLAMKAHTILCLAEQSERQSLTLIFDPKTRKISTGDGRTVPALSYESDAPGAV